MIGFLGLRGMSVIGSSGDVGVGSGCLAPDNKTVEFNAKFPSTCPFVTSVGGTMSLEPEIAWDASSGGFSKYFPRPAYQDAAVQTYLSTLSDETKTYYTQYTNFAGRGFPDVAAHALPNYWVYYAGKQYQSGGTSGAAPVFAAIVGLLNDARLRDGKSALGFLNPFLYAGGFSALTDVTEGATMGCNGTNVQTSKPEPAGSGIVPGARWNATPGWDPTTGWGTPDFVQLKNAVMVL